MPACCASSTGRCPRGPGQRSTWKCALVMSVNPCSRSECRICWYTRSRGIRSRAPMRGGSEVAMRCVKKLDTDDRVWKHPCQVTLQSREEVHAESTHRGAGD